MEKNMSEKKNISRRGLLKTAAAATVGVPLCTLPAGCKVNRGDVSMEVLNPRAELHTVPVTGLIPPRPEDLAGKRTALFSEKPDAMVFFDAMAKLLKEKYPTVTIVK
jgi:hypothetical protein